jgi:hypothetical protein
LQQGKRPREHFELMPELPAARDRRARGVVEYRDGFSVTDE